MCAVNDLLTPREAAQRIGCHASTLKRHTGAGKIPAIRTLGGHYRYESAVIEQVVAKLKRGETL